MADEIRLQVPDLDKVIEGMNEAGFLLKKAGGFQVQLD